MIDDEAGRKALRGQGGERKPVAAVLQPDGKKLRVVCDDGSVWSVWPGTTDEWKEQSAVRGTRRAREQAEG